MRSMVGRAAMDSMLVACWNSAFHRRDNWRGSTIVEQVEGAGAEIVCLPEAFDDSLGLGWHGIASHADYGYPPLRGRRKVTLWSAQPWSEVDQFGAADLPSGRFVAGTTRTTHGVVRVIGVCVPWRAAHVSTGHRNRRPWQDHIAYLSALAAVIERQKRNLPTLLMGDFNQTVPNRRAPPEAERLLIDALCGLSVWTGTPDGLLRPPVCHIAGSRHFSLVQSFGIPAATERGPVSDHDGVFVNLTAHSTG